MVKELNVVVASSNELGHKSTLTSQVEKINSKCAHVAGAAQLVSNMVLPGPMTRVGM
ncbi:hypothetical protein LguiA_002456 [Lonicera macranthoides]